MVIGYRMPIPPTNELLKAVKNPQGVHLSADFLCIFLYTVLSFQRKRCCTISLYLRETGRLVLPIITLS